MHGFLRQSTASQTRSIGPFVDDGDFKTLENALSIANTDILLKKNGAASAAKNSGGATADGSGGMYSLTFDATDTATVGELMGSVKVAGALVVFFKFTVLEEAVYDAQFAASAAGYQIPIWSSASATVNLSGTTVANLTNLPAMPTDWLTSTGLAASAVTEIQSGLATASALAATTAFIDTEVAAIIATLGTPAGASVSADLLVIDNLVDDLESRLTSGRASNLDNLDATVSSRLASGSYSAPPSAATISSQVNSDLTTAHGSGSYQTATGFSTHSAADIWSVTTRRLSDGTNIVLAKGTGITGFNDLDAVAVRTALGLASANLDTQLSGIAGDVSSTETEVAAILAAIGTPSNLGSGATLAANAADIEGIVDGFFTDPIAEPATYREAGETGSLAQILYELTAGQSRSSFTGLERTLYKLDGVTAAMVLLYDAESPTSVEEIAL